MINFVIFPIIKKYIDYYNFFLGQWNRWYQKIIVEINLACNFICLGSKKLIFWKLYLNKFKNLSFILQKVIN